MGIVPIGKEVPTIVFSLLHQFPFYRIVVQVDEGCSHFLHFIFGNAAKGVLEKRPLSAAEFILFPSKAGLAFPLET